MEDDGNVRSAARDRVRELRHVGAIALIVVVSFTLTLVAISFLGDLIHRLR